MPLKVYFDIPERIALGLASGRLERVGGVIRDSSSKQIAAWLRESGQLVDPEGIGGLLNAVQTASGGLTSVASGALKAAATARSHHLLMREIKLIQRLSKFTAVVGVLNLGIGAISFLTMAANANRLAELIAAEAERDRRNERESVIEYLELLRHLSSARQNLASELVVMPLLKARRNLLNDFEKLLNESRLTEERSQSAIRLLVSTMQLDVLHVRSYLDTEEKAIAKRRLRDCVKDYGQKVRSFVEKLLGDYPALYFHKDVSTEDFQRYLRVEEWLRDKDDILAELVEERRADFWNRDAIRALNPTLLDAAWSEKPIDPISALTMAESLIENLQRLEGYELEIATLRMSVAEWDRLANLEERDFAVVVDLDVLDDLNRVSYQSAS